jgi:hypothetical protein
MPLPIAPIASVAVRYGAVALIAYAASRRIQQSQTSQQAEDALDRVDEGLAGHRPKDREQLNGSARCRRVVRLGQNGPGIEIDATALGRVKFRRV